MKKRRFLSLLLVCALCFGMLPATVLAVDSDLPFTDVSSSDWFYDSVEYVYQNGLMNGTGDGTTFEPQTTTSRAMVVTILWRLDGEPEGTGEQFPDVEEGSWYDDAVLWASDAGIVNGYDNGNFGPEDPITREQMAAIFYRYADYACNDVSETADLSSYTDGASVSSWAAAETAWAVNIGLIQGTDPNVPTLNPQGDASRAEAATIIMRLCEYVPFRGFDVDEMYFVASMDDTATFTAKIGNDAADVKLYDESNAAVGTMHDDGKNGDETANDGIYTYELEVSADEAGSTAYYADAEGALSQMITLYYFAEMTDEEIQTAENQISETSQTLQSIEAGYADSTGYVPESSYHALMTDVEEYLEGLYHNGWVIRYVVEDESAYIKFASGAAMAYEPAVEETLAGGSDVAVAAYQPHPDVASSRVLSASQDAAEFLDGSYAAYENEQVTLSLVKSFGSNQVIYWNGHGGFTEVLGSHLATGEYFQLNTLDIADYALDRVIAVSTEKQDNLAAFTSKFVSEYCTDLANDIVFLSSCHSGQTSTLANAFLDNGAIAVVGFTDTVYSDYGTGICSSTLEYMMESNGGSLNTLEEALSLAKSDYGENDRVWYTSSSSSQPKSSTAAPKIFGGENARNCRLTQRSTDSGDTEASDFAWTLDDEGTLTISGNGAMPNYDSSSRAPWYDSRESIKTVVIEPGITKIGDRSFDGCINLTNVTIPDSVTSIGHYVFSGCSSLTGVEIPDSVTRIGSAVFSGCSSLTGVEIPNSVTRIGDHVFSGCSSLVYVTIPDGITSIGMFMFNGCSNLESIDIPSSVTSIGYNAFDGCSSLTSIDIPDSVTSIGSDAFAGCSSLISITIPNSVTSLGDFAFSSCTSLISVVIPDSITSISFGLLEWCTSLENVTIPDSVTSIEDAAFMFCSSLKNIYIPDSVTSIGVQAFDSCTNLESIRIPNGITSIEKDTFRDCSSLSSIYIPDSVTSIGNYAFYDCVALTSISLPNSVTSIGNYAFYGCVALTSISLPNSVTSIGDYAFYGCSSLTSIIIPEGVTNIGDFAFYRCVALTSISMPNSVTSIGDSAFDFCDSLADVYYSGTEAEWNAISVGSYNSKLTRAVIHYNS